MQCSLGWYPAARHSDLLPQPTCNRYLLLLFVGLPVHSQCALHMDAVLKEDEAIQIFW